MYVNYLFCMNEKRRKKSSEYFIRIPEEQLVPFPSAGRKRSVSPYRKEAVYIKFPMIKSSDASSKHFDLNSSVTISHAGKLPKITQRKTSLLTMSHHHSKLDQSSQANF